MFTGLFSDKSFLRVADSVLEQVKNLSNAAKHYKKDTPIPIHNRDQLKQNLADAMEEVIDFKATYEKLDPIEKECFKKMLANFLYKALQRYSNVSAIYWHQHAFHFSTELVPKDTLPVIRDLFDVGSGKISLSALKKWLNDSGLDNKESKDFNKTPKALFFCATADLGCYLGKKDAMFGRILYFQYNAVELQVIQQILFSPFESKIILRVKKERKERFVKIAKENNIPIKFKEDDYRFEFHLSWPKQNELNKYWQFLNQVERIDESFLQDFRREITCDYWKLKSVEKPKEIFVSLFNECNEEKRITEPTLKFARHFVVTILPKKNNLEIQQAAAQCALAEALRNELYGVLLEDIYRKLTKPENNLGLESKADDAGDPQAWVDNTYWEICVFLDETSGQHHPEFFFLWARHAEFLETRGCYTQAIALLEGIIQKHLDHQDYQRLAREPYDKLAQVCFLYRCQIADQKTEQEKLLEKAFRYAVKGSDTELMNSIFLSLINPDYTLKQTATNFSVTENNTEMVIEFARFLKESPSLFAVAEEKSDLDEDQLGMLQDALRGACTRGDNEKANKYFAQILHRSLGIIPAKMSCPFKTPWKLENVPAMLAIVDWIYTKPGLALKSSASDEQPSQAVLAGRFSGIVEHSTAQGQRRLQRLALVPVDPKEVYTSGQKFNSL